MTTQRTVSRARIKDKCRIKAFGSWITVEKLPCRVNHNALTYKRVCEGTLKIGMSVRLRVQQLVLDEGTPNERYVYDCHVLGDASYD